MAVVLNVCRETHPKIFKSPPNESKDLSERVREIDMERESGHSVLNAQLLHSGRSVGDHAKPEPDRACRWSSLSPTQIKKSNPWVGLPLKWEWARDIRQKT